MNAQANDNRLIDVRPKKNIRLHWFNATCWLLLVGSGLGIISGDFVRLVPAAWPELLQNAVGGNANLVLMHAILGIVWMLVIGLFAVVNLREQTISFLKEILVLTPGKAIRAGTYMAVTLAGLFGLMKSVKVAPQGRYNGAVQLLATMIIFGSLAIVATGLYLFFAPMLLDFAANPLWGLLFRWSLLVHFLAVAVVLMGLVAHIYFGVVEERESLEAMKSGKLDVGFIKHHSPLWYEELKKEGRI